jgi:hypothetical protein
VSESELQVPGDLAAPTFGPPRTVLRDIYEITPETLEQIAMWIEQRGLRTPVSNIVGGSTALTRIYQGTGSPETVVAAVVGSLYLRLDGAAATTLYVKESGSAKTGWIAK